MSASLPLPHAASNNNDGRIAGRTAVPASGPATDPPSGPAGGPATSTRDDPAAGPARSSARTAIAAALALAVAATLWLGPPGLASPARLTLIVFALAVIGWTVLRLPETTVALAAALALVLLGVADAPRLYASLGDELVWLLLGAFVLAAALRASGLAERYALRAAAGAGSVRSLFYRLALVIGATAFVVPSTSGRAALLLPVFVALAGALGQPRLTRALALLFPTAILLTACASLLGAGAHLVAVEFLRRQDLPAPGFAAWIALGAPFALASALAATELILRLFLSHDERAARPKLPPAPTAPLQPRQRALLAITAITVLGWAGASWHGLDAALVALMGALAATCRPLTGTGLKEALKGVEWNLLLFVAATLVLGDALLASGAAQWAAQSALALLPAGAPPLALLAAVTVVAMLSHLLITSRTARAVVLIPAVALPLAAQPAQAVALVLLVTMASGFCQTLRASAKPVALYARDGEREHYADGDLLRLSLALMPAFALLLLATAAWLWPLLGVSFG